MKKRILSLALVLALVMTMGVVPAFAVSTGDLTKQRETEHFEFYCTDQDVKTLDDLAESFEGCYDRVTIDLGKAPSGKTRVNIYPDIQSYHEAMGRTDNPDWVVGEAKDGAIHMASLLNPGPSHDYDDVIQIAVHEFTHIVINLFGNVPIYLNEGVACYEARQYSGKYEELSNFITTQMKQNKVPSLSTLEKFTSFSEGVYEYSYAFVDFIARYYGFDAVIALLEGKSLAVATGMNDASLNNFWWQQLDNLYVTRMNLTESLETDNFVLLFTSQDSKTAAELAETLEKARTIMAADLGMAPKVKTMLFLSPDLTGAGLSANANIILCGSPDSLDAGDSKDEFLSRILTYGNVAPLFSANKDLPVYLGMGVGGHEAAIQINGLKEFIKKAVDGGTQPTLAELEKLSFRDGAWEYGYAYVDFVAQTLGNKNLNDNLISLVKGTSQEKVFGMTSQELETAWQAFLKDYDKQVSVPNLDTADTWAQPEITSAVRKGFVPADLQNNYRNTITREQFCRMAVMYLEYATGKDIDTILAEKNLTIDPDAFEDTDNEYILAAYALGITNGTTAPTEGKPGVFAPDGSFSREMAATMLARVSKVLGKDTDSAPDAGYTDIGDASNWAVSSINFCYASEVMNGTSTTPLKFSPKGTYTIQQSIATFDRMG